jgi:two-component system sensor histidine kinase ChvG
LRHRGWLIAQALSPTLDQTGDMSGPALNDQLQHLADDGSILKLMFRPNVKGGSGDFYFIASAPKVTAQETGADLDTLAQHGILKSLSDSCSWDKPVEIRQQQAGGAEEVMTSIIPITGRQGCWVLITATNSSDFLRTAYGRPFWQTENVRMAAVIYLVFAALALLVALNMRGALRRFRAVAREIRRSGTDHGATFANRNTLPELAGVAADFDRLVDDMHRVAQDIRRTAEDNAHSVKAPLAVIRSSLPAIRRAIPADDQRALRSAELIDSALTRLSSLVSMAQRLGNETADFIEAPKLKINLTAVVGDGFRNARDISAEKNIRFVRNLDASIQVLAPEGIMDVIVENILDNAIGFSPRDGTISTTLRKTGREIELRIEDEGPGIDAARIDHIFERNYSHRPNKEHQPNPSAEPSHAGLGLWIVQRYVEALGGKVAASNRASGGLCIRISLPGSSW